MNATRQHPVAVVGAGMAGLTCALTLVREHLSVRLFEADDAVGGRVRTDQVGRFRLDRGFQVLQTAYPEVQRLLDLQALRLGRFLPGALVRVHGLFERVVDPFRRPGEALVALRARVGSTADKLRLARLRWRLTRGSLASLSERPERTTEAALRDEGFGPEIVERFFRPFLAGVFLERELATSSRMFDFVFRMFALGDAALPAGAMEAIPRQLASRLPIGALHLHSRVQALGSDEVELASGETFPASAIVVATDADEARRLVGDGDPLEWNPATTLYYDAPEAPVRAPMLVLDGEGCGPINHLCVPSQVAAEYAPPGRALVSASAIGVPSETDAALDAAAREQLAPWFGPAVGDWRLLRVDRIPHALPRQGPPLARAGAEARQVAAGLFVCGDHLALASLNGAMASGRRAAEAVAHLLAA